jgi:hypothetical protein
MTIERPMFPPTAVRRGAVAALSRRKMMIASAAAMSAGAMAAPVTAITAPVDPPDPIFAVIAEHRAAIDAAMEAARKCGNLLVDDPLSESLDALSGAAWQRESEAVYPVLTQRPTTLAGAVALLRHVSLPEFLEWEEPERTILESELESGDDKISDAARTFLKRLAATMAELTAAAA